MTYSVTLGKIVDQFELEAITVPGDFASREILSKDVNRPSIHLTGYYSTFDANRIQIMGKTEISYIEHHDAVGLEEFFQREPVAVIVSRELEVPKSVKKYARQYDVPLFLTDDATSEFIAALTSFLYLELAERKTIHGVFVEVHGEGVLLLGESGVGKSETAAELIIRGHRLIADDAVEVRRVSRTTILGTAPDNIRYFLELRGIGIVNAQRLFGVGALKTIEKISFVIELESWKRETEYDRIGLEDRMFDILGVEIPSVLIPINPGRNLAVIVEVAAMNMRQKRMGYNSAKDLLSRLKNELY